jgi:hypothetical protein
VRPEKQDNSISFGSIREEIRYHNTRATDADAFKTKHRACEWTDGEEKSPEIKVIFLMQTLKLLT